MSALQEVEDPELDISIVELGLVYDVRFEDKEGVKHAEVDMTLTSPGCPAAAEIMAAAHRAALNAVESVHINLVWSPRWDQKFTPLRMREWTWEFGIDSKPKGVEKLSSYVCKFDYYFCLHLEY